MNVVDKPAGSRDGQAPRRRMNFQVKFLAGMGFILFSFALGTAFLVYLHEKSLLEEAAQSKSHLVMASVEAARSYVQEELRPKMYEVLGQEAFVLEAMSSSYVTRSMMDRFNQTQPDFKYRRVALNPRNSKSEPDAVELELIERFTKNPDLRDWSGIVENGGKAGFLHGRPVYFTDDCLRCHGDPADAPPGMIEIYGPIRGFGHKSGEIAGVTAVSIPVEVTLAKIKERAVSVFGVGVLVLSLLFAVISFFFNRTVVHSLRDLLDIFRQGLSDETELELLKEAKAKDEIGELSDAATAMSAHLRETRSQLAEYTRNLEQMVAARTREKELMQNVFDGITDVMVLLDKDRRIKMVNKAYLDCYDLKLGDVVEHDCRLPHSAGECPFESCKAWDVFETGRPVTEEVKDREGRVWEVRHYPLQDEHGETTQIVRYAKDVTQEKQVEERIQQTEKLAALGQLAAGLAHEINNPLGVILCYTDLLKRQLVDFPQGLSDVGIIEKHSRNCQRIVADLLKFARGEVTEKKLMGINPFIEEVTGMVGAQFRRRVEIELDLAGNIPPIEIDPDKIKQVFLNLLMNSRQAIKDKGRLRIQSRYNPEDGQVYIKVWDNGEGIDPAIRSRIFDPFFSTKDAGQGTGLGLSVSYGIIKDHGGEITVESAPGVFTEFTITLPVGRGE